MDALQRRKKKTLEKLGWACAKIETLLAGQDIELADILLPHEKSPGETKLERLRNFKKLLNETLAELSRGERRTCLTCQASLGDDILDEMPWAFACRGCAAA